MVLADDPPPPVARAVIPFHEALRVWVRVAVQSFGGPAGQIAVMHRILVEEKRWVSEARFLHALNYCMLLPGPEAQQLATYVGWLLHGPRGGLVAGTLFVLPGFVSILVLSVIYARFQDVALVTGLFFGLKAAVLAIVAQAVVRIGKRVLHGPAMVAIAAVAFVAIFFLGLPFPAIVLGAGLMGLVGGRLWPASFAPLRLHRAEEGGPESFAYHEVRPSARRALSVIALFGVLWAGPIALAALALGGAHVLVQEMLFFSRAAVVTFGGAYAVLAYIGQAAVETYGWLQPGEMLDGLSMAETTPGPLIQVVQFVGFLGAHRAPAPFGPMTAGVIGSVLVTWVTYVPCFLWILLGAPYVEALRENRLLGAALSAITAAVVGVILHLGLWLGLHTVFAEVGERSVAGLRVLVPVWRSLDLPALLLTLGAFVAAFRFRVGMFQLLAGCAAIGAVYSLAAGV